jgi:hypothetical protein
MSLKMGNLLHELYSGLFPRRFQPKTGDLKLLKLMYPNINWGKVAFYNGLPWYMRHTFAFATALPHSYSPFKVNIYFKKYDADNLHTLPTLVHELFHVQQYHDLQQKWPFGFGYCRSFLWHYLGWFIALFFKGIFILKLSIAKSGEEAYTKHPMEVTAYAQEWEFNTGNKRRQDADLIMLLQLYPNLIRHNSAYVNQRPPLWAMIPAILLSLFITITKPLLELLLLLLLIPYIILSRKKVNSNS